MILPPSAGGNAAAPSVAALGDGGCVADRSAETDVVPGLDAFEVADEAIGRSGAFAGGVRVGAESLGEGAVAVRPAGPGVLAGVTRRVRSSAICSSTDSPIASATTVSRIPSALLAKTLSVERARGGGGTGGVDCRGRVGDGKGGGVERGVDARDGAAVGWGPGRFHSPGGTVICGPRRPAPRRASR